ncbi:DUF1190 domain-containing protein [Ferrovibrio sp.]|uniref:DUF1190 domain-containing protein n=1 Tax=Ferrovibrio sp. TaxID=1917215 RepID=UPI0025BEEFE3|nr:DUF1190 domain-containing protein [Ferrovibrio sp.]MBX3454963.1 DUF1190 domain-containing protein [Ferrovibrio sp.]
MRKSRSIRLVLLGSLSLVALAACEENDPLKGADIIRDQKECASRADPDACRMALADARQTHVQTAPKFANRQECEAQFGANNCGTPEQVLRFGDEANPQTAGASPAPANQQQAQQGGGSVFMPLMMGYMMGRMMGGAGGPWAAQPMYRDAANTGYVGNRAGTAQSVGTLSAKRFPDIPPATSVARRGFGATGTAASASASS